MSLNWAGMELVPIWKGWTGMDCFLKCTFPALLHNLTWSCFPLKNLVFGMQVKTCDASVPCNSYHLMLQRSLGKTVCGSHLKAVHRDLVISSHIKNEVICEASHWHRAACPMGSAVFNTLTKQFHFVVYGCEANMVLPDLGSKLLYRKSCLK